MSEKYCDICRKYTLTLKSAVQSSGENIKDPIQVQLIISTGLSAEELSPN